MKPQNALVRRCFRHRACQADAEISAACWDIQVEQGKNPIPRRVVDIEEFWSNAPFELSARCRYWHAQISAGWKRNKRLGIMGYDEAADYFGVWIWEWCNVLWPLLREGEGFALREGDAASGTYRVASSIEDFKTICDRIAKGRSFEHGEGTRRAAPGVRGRRLRVLRR